MPKLVNFRVKFVIFRVKKVVLDVCYDRNSSAVIGYRPKDKLFLRQFFVHLTMNKIISILFVLLFASFTYVCYCVLDPQVSL